MAFSTGFFQMSYYPPGDESISHPSEKENHHLQKCVGEEICKFPLKYPTLREGYLEDHAT